MDIWGRVDTGDKIVEFIGHDPEGVYHPDIVWVTIPEGLQSLVNISPLIYKDGIVTPESASLVADNLCKDIASIRFVVETSGTILADGTVINTDRETQSILAGIVSRMEKDPAMTLDFKTASGWAKMDKAMADAFADAIAAHVQACFSREKDIDAILTLAAEDGDVEVLVAAYDDEKWAGWPADSVFVKNQKAATAES